jgi:hypothetical protein
MEIGSERPHLQNYAYAHGNAVPTIFASHEHSESQSRKLKDKYTSEQAKCRGNQTNIEGQAVVRNIQNEVYHDRNKNAEHNPLWNAVSHQCSTSDIINLTAYICNSSVSVHVLFTSQMQ